MNLDLLTLFQSIPEKSYSIIRGGEANLINYEKNSDIDIFCLSIANLSKDICKHINQINLPESYTLRVRELSPSQTHIDVLKEKNLEIKLDLYEALPSYKKSEINPSLFSSVIENSILNNQGIYTPSKIDDLLIRYLEYVEYYELRPDKIKHLHYIEKHLEDTPPLHSAFFKRLHYYTDLPKCQTYTPPHSLSKGLPAEALPTQTLLKLIWKRFLGKN
jgi:hypothetical protein